MLYFKNRTKINLVRGGIMSQGRPLDKKKQDIARVPPDLKKKLPDIEVSLDELSKNISQEQLIAKYQDAYSCLQKALEEKNITLDTVRLAYANAIAAWDMLSGFVVLQKENENEGKSVHDRIGEPLPSLGLMDYRTLCQQYIGTYMTQASEAYSKLNSSEAYSNIKMVQLQSGYCDNIKEVNNIISAFESILQAYNLAKMLDPGNVHVLMAQAKMYHEFAKFYEILVRKGTYVSVEVSARNKAGENYNAELTCLALAQKQSPANDEIYSQHQELNKTLEEDKEIMRKCACILGELERVQREIVSNNKFPLPQGKGEMYKVIGDAISEIKQAESGRDADLRSTILSNETPYLQNIQRQLKDIADNRLKKNWVHRTIFGNATKFYQDVPKINEDICQLAAPNTPRKKSNQ